MTVRKIAAVAGAIIAGVLLLIVVAIAALHTPPARRFVLEKLASTLTSRGVKLAAAGIDYNLLAGRFTLRDVSVAAPTAPELPALLHVRRISANLSLWQLFRGAYVIESAVIEDPALHVVLARDGRDNIPLLTPTGAGSGGPLDLLIDELSLTGGSLRFEDRRQKIDVVLPAWRLTVVGHPVTKVHDIQISLDRPGSAALDGQRLPIRALAARLSIAPQAIRVDQFRLAAGESVLTTTGTVTNLDDPTVDARLAADLHLDSLAGFAGLRQEFEGAVHVDVAVSGPLPALQVFANLSGRDLRLERFRGVDVAAAVSYARDSHRVRFETLSVSSPAVNVSGQASLAITREAGRSSVLLSLNAVNAERAGALYDLPVRIASRVSGQIDASFPGLSFRELDARVDLRLVATRNAAASKTIPVAGRIHAAIRGPRVDARIQSLEAPGLSAHGDVHIREDRRVGGTLQTIVELGQALSALSRYSGEQPPAKPVASGQVEIAADLDGTIGRPVVEAAVKSSDVRAGGLDGIAVAASARFSPERISVREATVLWREQSIHAAGSIGLQGAQPIDVRLRAQDLSLSAILAAIGREDLAATGTIGLTANLGGNARRPRGEILLTGSGLSAMSEPLGEMRVALSVDPQTVRIASLELRKAPGQALTAAGAYDLDSGAFSLHSEAKNFELRRTVLPDGSAAKANLSFTANLSGTREDPRGRVEFRASDLEYRGEPLGELAGEALLGNREAAFDLRAPKYQVSAKGAVGVNAPYAASVRLAAGGTDLGSLPLTLKEPLKGTVTAGAEISGPLSNPEQLAVSGRAALDLLWRGEPIRSVAPIVARYANGLLTVEQGAVAAAGSELAFSGSIPLEPSARAGALRFDGALDLGGITRLAPVAGYKAEGVAKVNGILRGSLKRIDPQLTVTLRSATISPPGWHPVTGIDLELRVENGAVMESLTAAWAGARIRSSGTLPLGLLPQSFPLEFTRQGGPAGLSIDVENLQLSALPQVPGELGGTVSLRLQAGARAPRLEAVEGELRFTQLDLKIGELGFRQAGDSTIVLRNGEARIEHLQFAGPKARIQVGGSAALRAPHGLDLQVAGDVDAALAAAFSGVIQAQGPIELAVNIGGNAAEPRLAGFITVTDASFGLSEPRVAADSLNARIRLEGARAVIERMNADLNGGELTGKGSFSFANAALQSVDLSFGLDGVYLDYQGFQTLSDGTVTLRSVAGRYVLGGDIAVTEGSYTEPLTLDRGLLGYIASDQSALELTPERSPMLDRAQFDIAVHTVSPLVVNNNLAQIGINADVRLVGAFYQPGLVGRITLEEGGELHLSERKYLVERGILTFANERRIEPALDILAQTEVAEFDISLRIQGGGGERIQTTLTSDPALPEPDILALLLTGQRLEKVRGSATEVAGRQALSLLTGSLTGRLGRGLERVTGLSQVRVEPNLIAAEADPTARLTLGQDLTRNLSLIYSMDLTNSSDQVYIAEYDLTRRFNTRAVKQEDNSYRFEFRHDFAFGRNGVTARDRNRRQRTISSIAFTGETPIPRERLRDQFGLRVGDRYNFFKARQELDDLRRLHAREDFLESRVWLERREEGPGRVALTVRMHAGTRVQLVYEGWQVPGGVRKQVRSIWQSGVFDAQRTDEASAAIRGALMDRGYLRPQIEASVEGEEPGLKRVVFDIQPGLRYREVRLVFEGARSIESGQLKEAIKKAGLKRKIYTSPGDVTGVLTRYYRERGYLDASIDLPRYDLDAGTRSGQIVFPVKEGPRYRIGAIRLAGNRALSEAQIREWLRVRPGDVYTPAIREKGLENIRDAYETRGYLDTEVRTALERHADAGRVDLTFQIAENRQSVADSIRVTGNVNTSDNLVRTQLELKPGQPLTPAALAQSRRNLYSTDAFQTVDIERKLLNPDASMGPREVALNVQVREVKPYEIRYGGYFDTERGPGGVVDFSNRNLLGAARQIGAQLRYDSDLRDGRLYFSQPLLKRFPLKTTATTFYRKELLKTFTTSRTGFSAQQETHIGDRFVLNYGYRIARTHTVDRDPDALIPLDIRLRVASLTASVTRETRDDYLDATRGSFASQAIEWSPQLLGSQLRFALYFGQYFRYVPLSQPVEMPWTGAYRPRWVYAGGVRVGLAGGFGGMVVPPSERFFSGGGTSVRGFEQNKLGPLDTAGEPLGGNALFVMNNEIRFPAWWIFDGVGFVDLGNVYGGISDFRLSDIRKAGGFGLRARTPYFLLRLDYGLKFDRRPGESRGRLFFSIGQAF